MGLFSGRNPASKVKLPEMRRVILPTALTHGQLQQLLGRLQAGERTMVACASLTSMNVAEVSALRWGRLNLEGGPGIVDGEVVPGFSAAVREQWYRRQRHHENQFPEAQRTTASADGRSVGPVEDTRGPSGP